MKLLLHIHSSDIKYFNSVKLYMNAFTHVILCSESFVLRMQLEQYAKSKGCECVATTSIGLMQKFDPTLQGSANDNHGYLMETDKIRLLLIPDLKTIYSIPHGAFLIKRYIKKLRNPESFISKSPFVWEYVTASNYEDHLRFFSSAHVAAVDIETTKDNLMITHCAYSGISYDRKKIRTVVFDFTAGTSEDILFLHQVLRKFNATACPKIFQNGEYDNSYFLRWNMPVQSWYFDTYNMMHCAYPELPKDLAFISAFYLRNYRFWKDEISANKAEYNAKDAHNTLFVFLAQLAEQEEYVRVNYLIEFPMVFPCLHSGIEGLLIDLEERDRLKTIALEKLDHSLGKLRTFIHPAFNPNSPKQVLDLLQSMGLRSATGTDKKVMQQFAERGPLEELLTSLLKDCRTQRKAIGTYYEYETIGNRLLYKLDPAGTETGRLASKASSFWCGTQIQNQPAYCKSMYIADKGWLIGEIDNSQSESRTTAYLSQDKNLMDTVENSPDFHCTNASLFFGIPFEQLYDVGTKKKLNEPIRDLSKRTNHGANYNMMAAKLVETMGTKNIFEAARLLKLPITWTAENIATFLLFRFDKTYPRVRGVFQQELTHEVRVTGKLVLPQVPGTVGGWTRKTFLQPWKSKPDLNAIVAHKPQSLSVQLINQAYKKIWRQLQLDLGSEVLRLKAQIHDSILFQYREDATWVPEKISEIMRIPCTVHGRTFVIPNDISAGKVRWKEIKVSKPV